MTAKLKIKYKTNYVESQKCPVSWELWEEDEWGREGRHWIVSLPDLSTFEDNERRLEIEQKHVNKTLNYFLNWIPEDMYNIRNSWAKKCNWTIEEIEEFEKDIEYDRWMYR